MKILHTEASTGWGGQEIRILREAKGMREKGHSVLFATQKGAQLIEKARKEGFEVHEYSFRYKHVLSTLPSLIRLILREKVDVINTHSSLDAWIAGVAARIARRGIVRTRHLSAPIRSGWNSRILYNWLADQVVTTCEEVVPMIRQQASLPSHRCQSIPTGVELADLVTREEEVDTFRKQMGIQPDELVFGTCCVLRSWKRVDDLLHAAHLLRDHPKLRWLIIGSGPGDPYLRKLHESLDLGDRVLFTGHLHSPYTAIKALDGFLLLSMANEGVSQASLQAAALERPLITTRIGGLDEVCLEGITGYQVESKNPSQVAEKVLLLAKDQTKRREMGVAARKLVEDKFTMEKTLCQMEKRFQFATGRQQ